jgi:hypothetical protein
MHRTELDAANIDPMQDGQMGRTPIGWMLACKYQQAGGRKS